MQPEFWRDVHLSHHHWLLFSPEILPAVSDISFEYQSGHSGNKEGSVSKKGDLAFLFPSSAPFGAPANNGEPASW